LIVVGRQFYLNNRYDLSTWKGGGMGMFAAADELANRYAKVYLIDAEGVRNPLVQLTVSDTDVLNRALEYPRRENFLRAAREIAWENWVPAFQPRPVMKVNGKGEPVSAADKTYRQMVPSPLRPETGQKKPSMEIQFWNLTYDPRTRHEHASLVQTFAFSAEDLFGPRGNASQ
jgi:hypothetical protein